MGAAYTHINNLICEVYTSFRWIVYVELLINLFSFSIKQREGNLLFIHVHGYVHTFIHVYMDALWKKKIFKLTSSLFLSYFFHDLRIFTAG